MALLTKAKAGLPFSSLMLLPNFSSLIQCCLDVKQIGVGETVEERASSYTIKKLKTRNLMKIRRISWSKNHFSITYSERVISFGLGIDPKCGFIVHIICGWTDNRRNVKVVVAAAHGRDMVERLRW